MFRRFKSKIEKLKARQQTRRHQQMLIMNSTSIGTTAQLFAATPHMLPTEDEEKRKSLLLEAED